MPFKVVGWYLCVGAAWILASDRLLQRWSSPEQLTRLQTVKGWLFLVVTSLLLWGLIKRDLEVIARKKRQIAELNAELEERVAQRTKEFAQANELLKQEIHQRQSIESQVFRLNGDLLRQKAELEAANRELEAFSYSVSHDMRAPLRRIAAFANVLQEDCGDRLPPEGQEHLKRILASSERLELLVTELLELSRVGRSEMHLKKLDLTGMAQEIAAELKRSEPARQVEFQIEEGMTASGDATLVRLVLENLLGNAFKYTGKKDRGEIMFSVDRRDGDSVYQVRDNGAGFDMSHIGKLFTPFQRLHQESEFSGVGVGLAIVQRIVQRHGGRVWAEAAPEKGASFYFTLGMDDQTAKVEPV